MKRFLLLIALVFVFGVSAQPIKEISYTDIDGDGKIEIAKIKTQILSASDSVLVYDAGGNIKRNNCCNFYDNTWVFDVYSDGKAELIIKFARKGGKAYATLYDDVDGDRAVAFRYNSTDFVIEESAYPTLTVIAEDGFWIKNGKINLNLEILGDGKVNIGQVYHPAIFSSNDGRMDFRITVYDDDRDGVPDYELRENLQPPRDVAGNMLLLNFDGKEAMWGDYIFWPYLGKGPGWWERGHNSASPPILVDWKGAKISTVQVMVSDRNDDGNCFILSPDKILRNKVNELSFENPFCFYDLAGDDDGYQEAVLRVSNWPDKKDWISIRYSWDQDNDGRFDFSIDAGRTGYYTLGDRYVSVLNFRDFSVVSIPFEAGPFWALDGKWDSVKFIDTNGLYWLGEGVYGHLFSAPVNYTIGNTVVSTTRYVTGRNYHRAEFSKKKNQNIKLYLSPIDLKLHLKYADKGTFTIRAKETGKWYGTIFSLKDIRSKNFTVYENIDYDNLNGDGYIDKWTYYVNDTFVKSLVYSDDVLVYYDRSKIKLLKNSVKPYVFESAPPRNSKEWNALRKNLSKYKKEFDPRDFEAMFEQFEGERVTIEGGLIRDFNLTEKGFRAYLDCVPVCVVNPPAAIEHEEPLGTGRYILLYDGKFKILKSTLPDLEIKGIDVSLSNETPREIEYVTINARVHNKGTEDIGPVTVQFFEGSSEKNVYIGNQTVPRISAGKSIAVSQRWLARAGVDYIYIVVDPDNLISEANEKNNFVSRQVKVMPLAMPPAEERLSIGIDEKTLKIALILLLGMIFLTYYIAREAL